MYQDMILYLYDHIMDTSEGVALRQANMTRPRPNYKQTVEK